MDLGLATSADRDLFEIPDGVAYFNCATNSPQLRRSTAALVEAAARKAHPWDRRPPDFFDDAERLRQLASGLFGGDADGYAVVPAASYGLAAAARAIEPQLSAGDRILLIAEDFPSNVLTWRRVAETRGATILTVDPAPDRSWTAPILAAIETGIRVVAIPTCHWTDGTRIDLPAVAAACRRRDALLVVDATQTLGAVPLDVGEIQPDFLVAAGYKWLLCSYGVGLLWVAPRWRDARPLEETWLARANAEDFAGLVAYSPDYMPGARRFDVGEKCTTLLPGAIAALEQLRAWAIPSIEARLAAINAEIAAVLERFGFAVAPHGVRGTHMFGARLPPGCTANLVDELRRRDVHISQRGASLRFSPHLHVVPGDVEQLTQALAAVLGG